MNPHGDNRDQANQRSSGAQQPAQTPGSDQLAELLKVLPIGPFRRATFIETYDVKVHGEHEVSFVLPAGRSRMEILREAQATVCFQGEFWAEQLDRWESNLKFKEAATSPERIHINACVEGGGAKTRSQQEDVLRSKNLEMPSLEDLATAFVVHYVVEREPLFGWQDESEGWSRIVRAVGGALYFVRDGGLFENTIGDDEHDHSCIAVAAKVPTTSA